MSVPVHRFETAVGVRWHWAEMGDRDPVVLLHGIPESWTCWKHQMPALATQFRVLAFDLKGYGRAEKADGDYTGNGVARERPEQMTRAMMWFFNSMLGAGVSLFDRSRHHGLPTRPVKPRAGWGVNAFARD